tara:strand:- start:64702 stop:65292 length:591 start_codon:yes stop_codon:yes gene_type:complete
MITRRRFHQAALASALAGIASGAMWPDTAAAEALTYTDDGLIYQPWFLDSFLIMNEDLADAHSNGKRFVVFWELKGCPYCKETHRVNLAQPLILDYVKSNFSVLQLNVIGSRIVTDFDGEELSERALAQKWQVKFTPTIQFFTDDVDAAKGRTGKQNEVARIPGYFKPEHFIAMFKFVREEAYKTQKFHEYVRQQS